MRERRIFVLALTLSAFVIFAGHTFAYGGRQSHVRAVEFARLPTAGDASLPGKCAAEKVKPQIYSTVNDFNNGRSSRFAAAFIKRALFSPYGSRFPLVGRSAIGGFVKARHRFADHWTSGVLQAPKDTIGAPVEAVYLLLVTVSGRTGADVEGGIKFAVTCGSGLIRRWVGPAHAPERSSADGKTSTITLALFASKAA